MKLTIPPFSPRGSVAAPPSKSMAHRLLIAAGLADGESLVRGIAPSRDVLATMDCLSALGVQIRRQGASVRLRGGRPERAERAVLPCRESGSTLRFLTPLCALGDRERTLTGSPALLARPLGVYESLFRKRGLLFDRGDTALTVRGPLRPGIFTLAGDVSSQFASGLAFALPLLDGDSVLRLVPPVESRAYIDMTLAALTEFGVSVRWEDETTLSIPGGQRYRPARVETEGDWSNAAFFLAMGVPVTGLREDSLQPDRICAEYFRALEEPRAVLELSGCPDLGPVLFACAALRRGGTFTGTRRLRFKESDRISAMAEELAKFGSRVTADGDRVTVPPLAHAPDALLNGHNDHRIAMALSVLCARTGGVIAGAEAVEKSFPDFFRRLEQLGAHLTSE